MNFPLLRGNEYEKIIFDEVPILKIIVYTKISMLFTFLYEKFVIDNFFIRKDLR